VSGEGKELLLEEVGSMKFSIMPRSHPAKAEDLQKLAFVLPEYFDGPDGNATNVA
jgi:5'-methylthioadenosine phosphorylase